MLNDILARVKSTIGQPQAQPAAVPPEPEPEPKPIPSPTPAPTPKPAPIDQSPRALALLAAEAAGWKEGDIQPRAKLLRHQPSKRFLLVEVPDWGEPVICHVKNALSWSPVDPRFDTLSARWSGMATAEGKLLFESADICKAKRSRDR